MLKWLLGQPYDLPEKLFDQVALFARDPIFFTKFGFSDSVMGRFDVLSLHTMLVCKRLGELEHKHASDISQRIFDAYVRSLDIALRQLGIGDTSVPKKKKKLVHSFYAHVGAFDPALRSGELEEVRRAVVERLQNPENGSEISLETSVDPTLLARHLLACDQGLGKLGFDQITSGEFGWPAPVAVKYEEESK